jgi:hypothetical protein
MCLPKYAWLHDSDVPLEVAKRLVWLEYIQHHLEKWTSSGQMS